MKNFILVFLTACGGAPFTLATASQDDAGSAPELDAATLPETSLPDVFKVEHDAAPELDAASDQERPMRDAAPAEASAETPDASPAPESAPQPMDVQCSLSVGNVSCSGAGVWAVEYNIAPDGSYLTCDATHPATASCPSGSRCAAYNQPGGTVYQGTCKP